VRGTTSKDVESDHGIRLPKRVLGAASAGCAAKWCQVSLHLGFVAACDGADAVWGVTW
jgi:hypothetical protein